MRIWKHKADMRKPLLLLWFYLCIAFAAACEIFKMQAAAISRSSKATASALLLLQKCSKMQAAANGKMRSWSFASAVAFLYFESSSKARSIFLKSNGCCCASKCSFFKNCLCCCCDCSFFPKSKQKQQQISKILQ